MQNTSQRKLSTTHLILIIGFALILVVIIVIGYLFISSQKNKEETSYGNATPIVSGNSYLVDENNLAEIEAQAAQDVADGMFLTTMNMEWSFTSAQEPSYDAYVANDASNSRSAFIEVVLSGEENPIFRSTVIPPGSALKEVTLGKSIEPGSYNAVCTYFLLGKDTNEVESTLSLEIVLHIEG